jgi:transcriptional antiterminator Rof (Rho-off)
MKNDPYIGIHCSLYDQLELWALRKQRIRVELKTGGSKEGTIDTFEADDEGEWALWNDGQRTRLDQIINPREVL